MQIKTIIEQLTGEFSLSCPESLSDMPITCCQLIFEKSAVWTPGTAYIQAEAFDLEPAAAPQSFFLLCRSSVQAPNAAVCHTGNAQDLYQAISVLLTEPAAYARALAALQRVAGAGQGIQALIDTAYQFLQNPIHVQDRLFSLIAASPQTPCGNAVYDYFLIHKEPQPDYLNHVEAIIMKFTEHHIHCAQLADYQRGPLKLINCSIGAMPHLLGGLEVLQLNRPFTQTDVRIIDQLALLLQIELFKVNNAAEQAGTQFEALMQDILRSRLLHPEILRLRLQSFPRLQNRRFCLLLSQIPKSKVCTLKYYNEEIMRRAEVIESFQYQNDLYFLIDPDLDETGSAALNELAVSAGTLLIASDPIDNLIHCPRIVAMLREALSVCGAAQGLFLFRGLYFKTLLHSLTTHSPLTLGDFVHPGIQRLKDYDQAHQTDFLATFKTYLQCQCSPTNTAAALHLHRNSLAYRIQKARQISGFSSEDPEDCHNFLLSIQIDEYLGT